MKPADVVLVSWLWKPHNRWRSQIGYGPKHILWLEHQLRYAGAQLRHVCVCEDADDWHSELRAGGVEVFPLWDWPRPPKEHYASDCYVRMGIWGEPGTRMAQELGIEWIVWTDCDVLWREDAENVVTDGEGERYWLPRSVHSTLVTGGSFGEHRRLWHGFNGSLLRAKLGSRPEWWQAVRSERWCQDTESAIVGSDQAAITRLVLEEMGEPWREPNKRVFDAPVFDSRQVIPWGWPHRAALVYFPFDKEVFKPWASHDPSVRREFALRAGASLGETVRLRRVNRLRRSR